MITLVCTTGTKLGTVKIEKEQAEAELDQAQHNWKLGFAEAEVGDELGNNISSYC